MDITSKKNNNSLRVSLSGRLDTITAPTLDEYLKNNLDGETQLTFDLKDLDYVSSAGLRVFLSYHKKMAERGSMEIENVNEIIMEIFDITGFTEILDIRA
ncbi:MAG: STAS domain-containing protein [Clostridia bacterium]|nr:STAS domain-containing protein [Clostridia bacterium]